MCSIFKGGCWANNVAENHNCEEQHVLEAAERDDVEREVWAGEHNASYEADF